MHKPILPLAAAALLALGAVTGCESTGSIAARAEEKAAVYASLKPWEKKYIEKGTVATGFTPDMVYIALGRPTRVTARDFPEGHAELWTYGRCYPTADAIRGFKPVSLALDSAYQPPAATPPPNFSGGSRPNNTLGTKAPMEADHGANESISKTGGPQGGSMEPADLPSYTIQVLFEAGQVARLSAVPNAN